MDAFEEEIRRLQGELNNLQGELDSIGRVTPPVDAADSPTALPIPRYNPNLRIAGVETTQGIQYFNFNGQGSGAAPNNSVVLVDNKTTILRVYPDVYQRWSGWHVPTIVTGEMWYESPPGFRWSIAPIGGPVPARPAGQVNRSNWDETLNFRLPAWQCTGSFTCTARLYDPARSSVPQEEQWRYMAAPSTPTSDSNDSPSGATLAYDLLASGFSTRDQT